MGEPEGYLPFPKGFSTSAIHHSQEPEQWDSWAVVTPLVTSTTFKQHGPAEFKKYEYGRSGNPTRNVLENVLAKLDNGKYGLTFASGLGATTTLFGLLQSGDNILVGDDVYGGTNRLFNKVGARFGLEITLIDLTDLQNLEKSIKPNTKVVWLETPTNPTLKVIDLKAASEITKKHNIILVVDNTFVTPYLQRPLDFGADLVLYSLTKYMNGHSDVVMGAIITSNKDLYEKLKFLQNAMGVVPAPFDCYQVLRSLKTLAIRMERHHENSLAIAKYLEQHPKVDKVLHPCLPSHPQYELTKRQSSGHSGVFSFYIKGGLEQSRTFLKALKVFTLAESLGGYESLIELPCVMTHASVPPELRDTLGISDTLIRLSVGIEDAEDLIADMEQAFSQIN
ncbi:cystathionine gamma-lyase-like [Anoplophora glabripennis]|uniref:cystathionine gamma-lyase-like n=1 Tax=Anoplophora glabripennis TaxID=217634 RepID=UPI000873A6AB|nr:cystathionine gamma-lyase-like [Anoplophora glabripennis]